MRVALAALIVLAVMAVMRWKRGEIIRMQRCSPATGYQPLATGYQPLATGYQPLATGQMAHLHGGRSTVQTTRSCRGSRSVDEALTTVISTRSTGMDRLTQCHRVSESLTLVKDIMRSPVDSDSSDSYATADLTKAAAIAGRLQRGLIPECPGCRRRLKAVNPNQSRWT